MQKIGKNKYIVIVIVIVIVIIALKIFYKDDEIEILNDNNVMLNDYNENIENSKNNNENINKIIVYITGSVKNEGIYELEENCRIADVIDMAGGVTESADLEQINLAYILEDGMKIYVPNINEKIDNNVKDKTEEYVTKKNESEIKTNIIENNTDTVVSKVNINKATQTELETLPGIGPSTALKIINYRKEKGKFKNIEDIKEINGIGDSKFEKIKKYICV